MRSGRVREKNSNDFSITCAACAPNELRLDAEVDVGLAHLQLAEENVAEVLVVVLAGVDERVFGVLDRAAG